MKIGIEAKKDDVGKAQFNLIPAEILKELAELYTIGAKKYGPHNWRKGTNWSRFMDALERHFNAWKLGEKNDPVDGQRHLIAVAWNAFALAYYELHNVGTDDRFLLKKAEILPSFQNSVADILNDSDLANRHYNDMISANFK